MSFVESLLEPDEELIFTINRGRHWYHYLGVIVFTLVAMVMIVLWGIFFTPVFASIPQPGPNEPSWTWPVWYLLTYGCNYGFPLLFLYATMTGVTQFMQVELTLTSRRLLGRAPLGTTIFHRIREIEIPLEDIQSLIVFRRRAVQVIRKSTPTPLTICGNFVNPQELVDRYHSLRGG